MNPNSPDAALPLGRAVDYPDRYDPARLCPIPRAPQRAGLGIAAGALPFSGVDIWNAYELSWLDARGKPQVALGEFTVPAASPSLIESKSLKLYLGAFNQERMADAAAVRELIARDLARACGAEVAVQLTPQSAFAQLAFDELPGRCIDDEALAIDTYTPDPTLLRAGGAVVEDVLRSDLLRSKCPVTAQPDWGSVMVRYRGPRIDPAGLLGYIVSFRNHAGFHEHCVETMFVDLMARCAPERLTVYARYTRRGGLDINPFRSNCGEVPPPNLRNARQ